MGSSPCFCKYVSSVRSTSCGLAGPTQLVVAAKLQQKAGFSLLSVVTDEKSLRSPENSPEIRDEQNPAVAGPARGRVPAHTELTVLLGGS